MDFVDVYQVNTKEFVAIKVCRICLIQSYLLVLKEAKQYTVARSSNVAGYRTIASTST